MKSSSASSLMTLLFAVSVLSLGIGVAWSRGDDVPSHRIAVCDIHGITDRLLASKRFEPRNEAERARIEEQYQRNRDELTNMYQALEKLDKSDPEYARRESEYREQFEQKSKESEMMRRDYSSFLIRLRHEAYTLAAESAEGIAKKHGYSYLLGTSASDKELKLSSDHYDYGVQIARRPLLMWPDETDISAEVESDLGL